MAEDPVPQIKTKVNPRQEKNRSSNEHEEFSGTKGIIQIRGGDSKAISNGPDCKRFIVRVAIATDAVSTA